MKPKSPNEMSQFQLFQAHFNQILNPKHPLILLANKINWQRFDDSLADFYCTSNGAAALPTRLLVGLHYLKHAFNESDDSVIERWIENPYWQYFCGFETMQHESPLHPTSMTKWRNRVGEEKMIELLQETISMAMREKQVTPLQLTQVNVDSTVQEKNITHPTDSKLYYKAIVKLARAARNRGIKLRQTYLRVGKKHSIQAARYAHARQFKRMRGELRKLRSRLGRVVRDIQRQVSQPDQALKSLLDLCERLHAQQPTDRNKLYSLHEPEVVCISKGKARTRYEFGQKISFTTSNGKNWILGIELCKNNPYDGHTLAKAIRCAEENTGIKIKDAYVDKGYRGHDYKGESTIHIAGSSQRNITRTKQKRRKRRSAIEPIIGHAKSDHRMSRCFLKGLAGDAINAILAAAGFNLRKLLRGLCAAQIFWLTVRIQCLFHPNCRDTNHQLAV